MIINSLCPPTPAFPHTELCRSFIVVLLNLDCVHSIIVVYGPIIIVYGPIMVIVIQKTKGLMSVLSEVMYVDLIPPKATPTQNQVLAAISTATELPEVMDSLIKRYQSLFL